MHRKTKKIVLALVVIGVVAAGGAAFTDANVVPATKAGYGTSVITGATVESTVYTLNGPGTTINAARLTIVGDLTANGPVPAKVVQAGFGTDNLTVCSFVDYNVTSAGNSVYDCTGFTQDTAASATFHVAVTS